MRIIIERTNSDLKIPEKEASTLTVDMHCHILPGLDDGSENMDIAVQLAKGLVNRGYKKIYATPHIMNGYYNNTEEKIKLKINQLKDKLREERVNLLVDYAAEYYLDDHFVSSIESEIKPITIGKNTNFVLLETSFVGSYNKLLIALELLFNLGYRPVLAHPERYVYLDKDNKRFDTLQKMGVLFQVNINSLGGYYSQPAKKKAEFLIDNDMVSFLGSNCHNDIQLESLDFAITNPHYQMALNSSRLLNNALF